MVFSITFIHAWIKNWPKLALIGPLFVKKMENFEVLWPYFAFILTQHCKRGRPFLDLWGPFFVKKLEKFEIWTYFWPYFAINLNPSWPYFAINLNPSWPSLALFINPTCLIEGPFLSKLGLFSDFWAIFGLIWPLNLTQSSRRERRSETQLA